MKLTSWLLRNLSTNDNSTDLVEYVLIASVLILGLVATCATLTAGSAWNSRPSRVAS